MLCHKLIKNYQNLTETNLNIEFILNPAMDTIFQFSDPSLIANVLTFEVNKIVEFLAPQRKINLKADYL